jgi:Protein of unknown function (DUF3995)
VQIIALVTGLALALIGVLHLVWTVTPWPLATREEFARTLGGRPDGDLPPPALFVPATVAVAIALVGAAYLVAVDGGALTTWLPDRLGNLGAWAVAAVLCARGVWGLTESGLGLSNSPASFRRLDLVVYSPLCLFLGALATLVALS